MNSDDKMITVRVLNQFDKYVWIDVNEDLYYRLEAKVKAMHSNTLDKMILLKDLNLTLDKLMLTSITEAMVNETINEMLKS